MKHFRTYTKEDVLSITQIRRFETRIGERIKTLSVTDDWANALQHQPCKYVLLGIPEDIGVKANDGMGGADTTWLPALTQLLNAQSNDFFTGEEMLVLGHFDFGDIKYLIENNAYSKEEKIDAYRHAVNTIDDAVEQIIKVIAAAGKIPLVIGGGQNNAYPIIKGVAKGLYKAQQIPLAQINCINLDAHPDFGAIEGRHNANAFHYAEQDGYLGKLSLIGVQENNISQSVLMDIHNNPFIDYITYEELFVHERKHFMQAVAHAASFTDDNFTGIELDMDCIEQVLSNNCTLSGISALQARQYITYLAQDAKVAYLHISEAAVQMADGRKSETTAMLIHYLIADFIKVHSRL